MKASKDFKKNTICLLLIFAAIFSRAFVPTFFSEHSFNSDEAIFGLMVKHLSEGKSFPIMMYGQKYLFAITVWLAAPFVRIFGLSVVTLKVILLLLNFFVGYSLWHNLRKSSQFNSYQILLIISFFALPSIATSSLMMEFSGCQIESLVFILLLWQFRKYGIWLGVIAGVGYMNRPFTLYGISALFLVDIIMKNYDFKQLKVRILKFIVGFSSSVCTITLLTCFSDNYYGGSPAIRYIKPLRHYFEDFRWVIADGIPRVLGLRVWPTLESNFTIPSALLTFAVVLFLMHLFRKLKSLQISSLVKILRETQDQFSLFLLLIGCVGVLFYVLFSPNTGDKSNIRYILPVVFGFIGFFSIYLQASRSAHRNKLVNAWICLLFVNNIYANCSSELMGWKEEFNQSRQHLISYLLKNNLTRGYADYWDSYVTTFLSNEQIILTCPSHSRVHHYDSEVASTPLTHRFRIQREPCVGNNKKIEHWFICPDLLQM